MMRYTTNHTDSEYDLYSECTLMGGLHKDIWFSYQAKAEGVVTLSTCDPDSFDTSIIVYESAPDGCDGLAYLACSGDAPAQAECQPYHSAASFSVTAGSAYMIRVGGWDRASFGSGTIHLHLDDQPVPQYCPADINKDMSIDGEDLLSLIHI